MNELVLLSVASEQTMYTPNHISLLLRQKKVKGKKQGGIWLVDIEDLKKYEADMKEQGTKKFDPTKYKEE